MSAQAHHEMNKLLLLTCGCGFGYFTRERAWVSGADVRAGKAPPRPGMYVPASESGDGTQSEQKS